jgi:tetratricopeptide (TPR) repeat protein
MKNILLAMVLIGSLTTGNTFCQNREELQENFDEGQYFFNRGDYEDALYFFLRLLKTDSLNANYNFKVGECYLSISGKEHLAIPYFEKAQSKIVQKKVYKKRSIDETAAPLHVYFYLGNAYRMDNQLDKALACYMKFIDSPFFYGNYNQNIVEKEIKTCERAKIIQDAVLDYEVINFGAAINSEFSEERPIISGDGNTIVFIRRLKFYDAVFFATKKDGDWQQAFNINPQILSDGEYFPSGLDYNGRTMLLVKKEGDSYDIYRSHFDGTTWSNAEKMNDKINSLAEEIHASFSPDDKSIIISSNKSGGRGGYDLYVSKISEEGSWKKSRNMGKSINTEFDERVAFLTKSPEVLFFSSQGHYTMGGYDIFYSKKDGKRWNTPVNIGYPINNTRDNLDYCPSANDIREGYLSMTIDGGFGGSDIYMIRIKSMNTLNFNPTDE